jgi:hypothetical protein
VQSSNEYYRTIAHTGCDNKGAKKYLQVQVKNILMARLWDTVAQYRLLERIQGGTIHHNGGGKLFHILIFSRKNECLYVEVLAYGTRNQAI